jgi:asparagine synthase (glutamine-hydrolysing)
VCGVNGIFAYNRAANSIDMNELIRTRDHMAARGPDDMGIWVSTNSSVGLGHRRLSIIDLSATGAQPMTSADGRFVVTFNGEIYNYRELRRNLEVKGRAFLSQSDTEVLLHLYAEKGEAMVHELRGMFAFAIWDAERGSLFVARDPYGIKPFYYADDGWTFRFASQVRALLAGGALSHDPDPAGQVGFYLFGSVPEPFTSYRDIRALPAGSTLTVDRAGTHEVRQYHSIAQIYCDAEAQVRNQKMASEEQNHAEIRAALLDSVRHHLVADVPVGAFLSAGIDSGALVGLMRDASQRDIQTVTLSFGEFCGRAEDETPLASEVARLYGTRHTTRVVTQGEFTADLPRILEAMDQPSIDGINTWFVSKAAHELGLKVAVSGLGGDELFGGYPSFEDIPKWVRLLAVPSHVPLLGKVSRIVGQRIAGALNINPKTSGMLELGGTYSGAYLLRRGLFMPWELDSLLDHETVAEGMRRLQVLDYISAAIAPRPKTAFGKVASLESSLYMRNQLLRDTDWASMAHSLEVRVPLVDAALLRRVAPITTAGRINSGKVRLSASPRESLPASITDRRKTGFGIPVGEWLQHDPQLQSWKRIPALADRHCPWARRWAYQLRAA